MRVALLLSFLMLLSTSRLSAQASSGFAETKQALQPTLQRLFAIAKDKATPINAAAAVLLPGAEDPVLTPPTTPHQYTDTGRVRLGMYTWTTVVRSTKRLRKTDELTPLFNELNAELERLFPGRRYNKMGSRWAVGEEHADIGLGIDIQRNTSFGRDNVWLSVVLLREEPGHAGRSADSVTAVFYNRFLEGGKNGQRGAARFYKETLQRLGLSPEAITLAYTRLLKKHSQDVDLAAALCQERPSAIPESYILSQLSPGVAAAVTQELRKGAVVYQPVAAPVYAVDSNDGARGKISSLGMQVGNTIVTGTGNKYSILRGYDPKTDEYIIWIPKNYYGETVRVPSQTLRIKSAEFRGTYYRSGRKFITCKVCNGSGRTERTYTNTNKKDLPQGYFSGVETSVTKTRQITESSNCVACSEDGVVLEP